MKRNEGFSLIELMTAVAILAIITSQLFLVFSSQRKVYTTNERTLDAQEEARMTLDLLEFDTRLAGFMVPSAAAVSAVNGGVNASDRLCVSDATYFEFPLSGQAAPSLDQEDGPFQGATITAFTGLTQTLSTLNIDGINGNDFTADAGAIFSDGVNSHCARIASIAGSSITLVAGQGVPGALNNANTVVVPAHVYEVDENALQLLRNNLVLASGIEDLQVEFWVDSSFPWGSINGNEWPVQDLANPPVGVTVSTSRLGRVRITVVARTEVADVQSKRNYMRGQRPAVADRQAGLNDNFSRRMFSASVMPRNIGKSLPFDPS